MSHSRHRAVAGVLALVVLLAAVAVASTGSVPAGTGRTRSPSDRVLDVAISLFVLLDGRRNHPDRHPDDPPQGLAGRGPRRAEAKAAPERARRDFSSVFGILAALIRWAWADGGRGHRVLDRFRPGSRRTGLGVSDALPGYEPEFATGPVLVVLAVIAIGAVAWTIAFRARRRELEPLPDSLDPGPHRPPRGDARRSPGRGRPATRGDRRVRAHGEGSRRLRAPPQPGRGAR